MIIGSKKYLLFLFQVEYRNVIDAKQKNLMFLEV